MTVPARLDNEGVQGLNRQGVVNLAWTEIAPYVLQTIADHAAPPPPPPSPDPEVTVNIP